MEGSNEVSSVGPYKKGVFSALFTSSVALILMKWRKNLYLGKIRARIFSWSIGPPGCHHRQAPVKKGTTGGRVEDHLLSKEDVPEAVARRAG